MTSTGFHLYTSVSNVLKSFADIDKFAANNLLSFTAISFAVSNVLPSTNISAKSTSIKLLLVCVKIKVLPGIENVLLFIILVGAELYVSKTKT